MKMNNIAVNTRKNGVTKLPFSRGPGPTPFVVVYVRVYEVRISLRL